MNTKQEKVVIIGWDGGTFDVLNRWVDIMPNFRKLINNGVTGELRSTIPPVTAPAWSSFMTGKNPGKHGVFGFVRQNPKDQELSLNNLSSIDSYKLWTVINYYGKKVGVADLPMTYPPEKLDGFMVSDLMTSGKQKASTYPSSLKKKILSQTNRSFDRAIMDNLSQTAEYLKQLISSIESKEELDSYLLNNFEWDCFITVYPQLDILQHYFWRFLDETHPKHEPNKAAKFQRFFTDFFTKLDKALGNVIEQVEGEPTVIMISDHGFGPVDKVVYINNFLWEKGYLKVKKDTKGFIKLLLSVLGLTPQTIKKLLYQLDFLNIQGKLSKQIRIQFREALNQGFSPAVDWNRSRAHFRFKGEEGIYINRKNSSNPDGLIKNDQEYGEFREHLVKELAELVDPETGKPIIEKIYRKEEIYSGKYVKKAPDVIIQPENHYWTDDSLETMILIKEQGSQFASGYHRPNGIFIAWGKNIRRGKSLENAEIIDIAPTVLYLMGLPVPKDMDGKLLKDIFVSPYVESTPIKYVDPSVMKQVFTEGTDVYSEEDSEEIKERLRKLGYL